MSRKVSPFLRGFTSFVIAAMVCTIFSAHSKAADNTAANILGDGDFEKDISSWRKIFNDGKTFIKEYNGNSVIRIEVPQKDSGINYGAGIVTTISLSPEWKKLKISALLRAPEYKPGKTVHETSKLFFRFFDKNKKQTGGWPCSFYLNKKSQNWKEYSKAINIPKNATSLEMALQIYKTSGIMEADNITITAIGSNTEYSDGKLPYSEKLYWGKEPVEKISSTRELICLNGLWQFSPGRGAGVPQKGWGYIRVPGAWSSKHNLMPGVIAEGIGKNWEVFNSDNKSPQAAKFNSAWYKREITIPANWRGQKILLDLRRVCTDAIVFIDKKKVGSINWPEGVVDITGVATPGKKHELAVRVLASSDKDEITVYMGNAAEQVYKQKFELDNRGITGDVFLSAMPTGSSISDVFVKPSVRKKKLDIEFELSGLKQPDILYIDATLLDESGKVEKSFTKTINAEDPSQKTHNLSFDWNNPRLWDLEQPNLYTLKLKVSGKNINDEYSQEFGFREFWIEGKKFILNGTEIRFRPRNCAVNQGDRDIVSIEHMDGIIEGMLSIGGNIQEFWPWDYYQRGTTRMLDLWFERADKKGWPVIAPLGSMRSFAEKWSSDRKQREEWKRLTSLHIKRLRNHPSVLIWIHSPNRWGIKEDQNPKVLGNSKKLDNLNSPSYVQSSNGAKIANEFIRTLDPTRPATTHQGGAVGDIHTINNYLGWHQPQEQQEWLVEYMQSGDMPYMPVEFGFFPPCDFRRGRNGWKGSVSSEDWMTEFLAAYFGEKAYTQEPEFVRHRNSRRFISGQKYKLTNYQPTELSDELMYLFNRDLFLSWRTMGITGGMLTWELYHAWRKAPYEHPFNKPREVTGDFKPGRRGAYVRKLSPQQQYYISKKSMLQSKATKFIDEAFAPTAAWITAASIPGDSASFTGKAHNYRSGETMQKQIAIINDTRSKQKYSCNWSATLAGKIVASGKSAGEIAPAKNVFTDITISLPQVSSITSGTITLNATVGKDAHTDTFAFTVFPASIKNQSTELLVIDPLGKSKSMLSSLGYELTEWDGRASDKLLIIGREGLSAKLPGSLKDFISAGGKVVVLSQSENLLSEVCGFRVGAQVLRRVFPLDDEFIKSSGITTEQLRDWRGSSTLRPVGNNTPDSGATGYPWHGWRTSNRGGVCSIPVEKPHASGWSSLMQCDFDLAYTPLMYLDFGKGRVYLSQLDFTDHYADDPACEKLLKSLINFAETEKPKAAAKTFYSGNDEWANYLSSMGVIFKKTNTIPTQAALLIIGPDSKIAPQKIITHINSGANVFVLPGVDTAAYGLTARTVNDFSGSGAVPRWKECRGVSQSELHVRAPANLKQFTASPGYTIAAKGLLARRNNAIFCNLDPIALGADTKTYLRFTRWRFLRALSQILTNMGATFESDKQFFAFEDDSAIPNPKQISLNGIWQSIQTLDMSSKERFKDPGISKKARDIIANNGKGGKFSQIKFPGFFENAGGKWRNFNGEAVFIRTIKIPKGWIGKDLVLSLGLVDDFDIAYFNGTPVGKTTAAQKEWWKFSRNYPIPAKLVNGTQATIAVRILDNFNTGGIKGMSGKILLKLKQPERIIDGFYSSDYRDDYALGDDPHRYYRW